MERFFATRGFDPFHRGGEVDAMRTFQGAGHSSPEFADHETDNPVWDATLCRSPLGDLFTGRICSVVCRKSMVQWP
jgi:hypothetical protein